MTPARSRILRPPVSRGFSIVECAIATVIVGVALTAAISTVGAARRGEKRLTDSRRAQVLVEDLMAEIAAQPYQGAGDTATVFGPNTGETTPGNRSLFNDVNDYRNRAESPPLAKSGASLGLDSSWRRSVQVDFVSPTDPRIASATDQGLAKVTVVVARNSVPLASLCTLRSAGLPATEMCTLSNGTKVNLAPAHCLQLGGTSAGPGTNCWTIAEPPDQGWGLLAHWKMNESGGSTAADSAGTNTATLINTPIFAAGNFGNALKLDGVDEYASVPHTAALSLNSTFTLASWMYCETLPGVNRWYVAIFKGTSAFNPYDFNYALAVTNGKVDFEFIDTAGVNQVFVAGSVTKAKRWYHLAATYDDAANSVRIYLDGALVSSVTTLATPRTDTGSVWLGGDPYGDYTKGRIDDVRIYNRVLSAAEISTLFNGGEP